AAALDERLDVRGDGGGFGVLDVLHHYLAGANMQGLLRSTHLSPTACRLHGTGCRCGVCSKRNKKCSLPEGRERKCSSGSGREAGDGREGVLLRRDALRGA